MAQVGDNPTFESKPVMEEADALYAEGMAHYRRREWGEAKQCFSRLKSVAPERRDVDALLNEVDIFIQLEAMQPEGQDAATELVTEVTDAASEDNLATPKHSVAPPRWRWGRKPLLGMILVLLAVAAGLYATGSLDAMMGSQQGRIEVLVNQGRAAMNVADYDRAVRAFGEALALAPTNQEIKTWYAKAERYQQLATWYAEAEADIAAARWDSALTKLNQVAETDPTYNDVNERIAFVQAQQTLDVRFSDAKSRMAQGDLSGAIVILEDLRDRAPSFRAAEVKQTLFSAFFQDAVKTMSGAADSLDMIRQAIQEFDRALALFPEDKAALEEKRLADLYRQGYLFVNQQDWPQAVAVLQQIYAARPDYMAGGVAAMLCTAYSKLGDTYQSAGDLKNALEQYKNVLNIEGCDHVEAAIKERQVYAILYPPTPTPTYTPMPTATLTPAPTLTPTAEPTSPPATARPAPTDKPKPTEPPRR